ncbi:MAG TPA: RNA 2',3'-cyclic phosphodiesterase [Gammaproteobacteria bacterium]|nr:RNA 2',3'-cyclic phosphodiesterase [Gammaproteobacteria bacterium]
MVSQSQLRIFFALWPDAATRARLAAIAARIPLARPARRVPDYNLHLTLHFVGNVDPADADCMRRQARAVGGTAFELAIDSSGQFDRARVGWLGPERMPDALLNLHRELGLKLRTCGYQAEKRAYSPHVSVVRKLNRTVEAVAFDPLLWKVDNFVLVESRAVETGVRYQVVESYPLS